MTPAQQKYLKERISQITNDKIRKLADRRKYQLSEAELDELVSTNQYKVVKDGFRGFHVIFPKQDALAKEYNDLQKEIREESKILMDKVMLSDLSQATLDALEAFANK